MNATDMNFTSYHNCSLISERVPLDVAIPLYGYIFPLVILITLVTNTFIVLVLSQSQFHTPTNTVLLAMAVAECLTGLAGFPFIVYYYTYGGHETDELTGLPYFWCRTSELFSVSLPTIFHTSAIWLTVYLAVHRYFYVREPRRGSMAPTGSRRTKIVIAAIIVCATVLEMPRMLSVDLKQMPDPYVAGRIICCYSFAPWTHSVGINVVFMSQYWTMALLVHACPCLLLSVFVSLLIHTVSGAARRRRESLRCSHSMTSCTGLHATTKMLIVIVTVFLITEIPAAVIFIFHACLVTLRTKWDYYPFNVMLILRNMFILISFPFNFAIYLSMSAQFRAAFKNLLLRKRFVTQTETTGLLNMETRKATVASFRMAVSKIYDDERASTTLVAHRGSRTLVPPPQGVSGQGGDCV